MNSVAVLDLYDKLRLAPDETARARLIAEAFAALETRYPHLDDLVTTQQLSAAELRLLKEIEQVRAELKTTELKLTKEIEQVRTELKVEIEKVHSNLKIEIERIHGSLKVDLANSHAGLLKWNFLFWLTQFSAVALLLWRLWGLPAA